MKPTTCFLTAGLCCASPVWAGQSDHPADSVINLNQVEIVATRATASTPVAFTNISAKELERANSGVDLPYLLLSTPSVITTSDAGAGVGYTSIRVRGTDGARINVTANGVPINDAESHNVYWVNMPDLASSLKDVQIQRGAGTSTNGAGAFGASINMATLAPATNPYAKIDASYGMYATNKQTVRTGTGRINNHWSADVTLSHIGSNGYIDRASSELWSYFTQAAYTGSATSLKLLAFGGKERTYQAWDYATAQEMQTYGRRYNPCGKYTADDGSTAFYPNQYDNYTQHHFHLILNQAIGRYLHLNAALHLTKGDGYYDQYKTNRTLSDYGLTPFYDSEGNKVKKSDLIRYKNMDNLFGGGVFALTYTRGRLNATAGGGANRYRGHHFGQIAWVRNYIGPINPLQEYYRNLGDKTDANLYAKANFGISRQLSAYADLQWRHIDYSITGVSDNYDWNIDAMQPLDIHRHFNFVNPKAGINYQITPKHRTYASVMVAHKEPTRDNFIDAPANRQPKPEQLVDWELGYNFTSHLFSAGINFYYMDYTDQLVPTGELSDTGNPVQENVPDSYRAGIELTMVLKPAEWFDWQFTTTLSRNRVNNFVEYIYDDEWINPVIANHLGNTPLAFSPEVTLRNSFNFTFRQFDASVQSRFVGKQYLTNTGNSADSLPHYFVTDLHLGYTFRHLASIQEMRIGCSVYNLFSEHYCNNGYAGAGYYMDNGQPVIYRYAGYAAQAPIHVMASVSLTF